MILLAGDSFALGEHSNQLADDVRSNLQQNITHTGLQQYLQDAGHIVFNTGRVGDSNAGITKQITSIFCNNPEFSDQIKIILVYQTEWCRNIFDMPSWIDLDSRYDYHELKYVWISRFYYELSKIACLLDKPIYVIGGCSDTLWLDKWEHEYPGVTIACQSLTNLIENGDHRIQDPIFVSARSPDLLFLRSHCKKTSNGAHEFIKDASMSQARLDTWKITLKNYFGEDQIHPNRKGLRILFDHLCTQIPYLQRSVDQ
jgi:hypothetical protein